MSEIICYDVYDASRCTGWRIEKNVNGTITRFYHDRAAVIEEQNAADSTVATYVKIRDALDGTPDDGFVTFNPRVQMQRNGTNYFFHTDDLGSIVKVTDQAGSVVEQYLYRDFGQPLFFDGLGTNLNGSAIGNAYQFHGLRFDSESAFYLHVGGGDKFEVFDYPGAYATRPEDPRTGKFLTRDAGGGKLNALTYAANNPTSHSPRSFTVQYRETDFEFVSRLLEEEGIYHFFEQEAPRRGLVFKNDPVDPGGGGLWDPPAGGNAPLRAGSGIRHPWLINDLRRFDGWHGALTPRDEAWIEQWIKDLESLAGGPKEEPPPEPPTPPGPSLPERIKRLISDLPD